MITLKEELLSCSQFDNILFTKEIIGFGEIDIYPKSVHQYKDAIFFIAKNGKQKNLFLYFEDKNNKFSTWFEGSIFTPDGSNNCFLKKCNQSSHNRKALQKLFDFTCPVTLGLVDSFGFGDRLGLANPAHLRSLVGSKFKPVLAQQSIRELTRTNRTPAEVMDAAVWAVFQEGYHDGFSADADHLKTLNDIDLMVENGFKLFTFDPGAYVHNEADKLSDYELKAQTQNQNWKSLETNYEDLSAEYVNKNIILSNAFSISANDNDLRRALIKYGDALVYIKKMSDHLKTRYPSYVSEVEVSIDETESVTSPFEHYFIANELRKLGVKIIGLAPRFVGDFEKGIDYKGDLNLFREEYIKHISIAKFFGSYKLSLHSGSDKFSVYNVIGSLNLGVTHIKTAGTSYLEALKVVAVKDSNLFRKILDFSREIYAIEKESYHVSANLNKISPSDSYSDKELVFLFNINDARQILHVTFGRVLTEKNESGEYLFKEKILDCLKENEEMHYKFLVAHFHKHLESFS